MSEELIPDIQGFLREGFFEATYPVERMVPFPGNARKGDVAKIVASIKTNGFYKTVIIQESTNHILVGNHSVQAAIECGLRELPCYIINVDDKTAKAINVADNIIGDSGTYDYKLLLSQVDELHAENVDLSGLGIGESELDTFIEQAKANEINDLSFLGDSLSLTTPPPNPAKPGTVTNFVRLGFSCTSADRDAIIKKVNDAKTQYALNSQFEALMKLLGLDMAVQS